MKRNASLQIILRRDEFAARAVGQTNLNETAPRRLAHFVGEETGFDRQYVDAGRVRRRRLLERRDIEHRDLLAARFHSADVGDRRTIREYDQIPLLKRRRRASLGHFGK